MRRQQQRQEHNGGSEGTDTAARIASSLEALKLGTRRRSSTAASARLPEQSPLQPRRVTSVQRKAADLAVQPLEVTAAAISDLSDVESLTDDFEREYQSHVRNAAFRKALHTSLSASLTNALSAGGTPQRKAANSAVHTEDQFDDDAESAFRVAALASSFAEATSPAAAAAAARVSPAASRAARTSPPCETCGARSSERADTVAGRRLQQQDSSDYAADDSALELTSNIELSSCLDNTGDYNDTDDAGGASPAAARLLDFLQSVERPAVSAQRSPHHDPEQQWRGSGSRSPQRRYEQRAEQSSCDVSAAAARNDAALFAESLLRSEHSAVGADEQLLSALAARVLSRLCQETLQQVGVRKMEHTVADASATAAGEREASAQSQQPSSNSSSKKQQSRSAVRVLRVKRRRQSQRSAKKSTVKKAARSTAAAAAADTSSDTAVVADADDSAASAAADLSIYTQHRAEMDNGNGAVTRQPVTYLQTDVRNDETTSVSPISSVSTAANVVTTDTPTAYGAVAAAEHTAAAPAAAAVAAAARRGRTAHPSRRRLFDEAADASSSSSNNERGAAAAAAAAAAATTAAALAAAEEDCSCSTAGDEREDRVLQQRAGGASPMSSVSPVPVFGVITTDSPTMYGAARHHSHSAGRMPWRPAHVDSTAVGTTSDSSGSSVSGDSEGCTNTDGSLQRTERYSSTLATSVERAAHTDTTAAGVSSTDAAIGAESANTVQQQTGADAVLADYTAASEHVTASAVRTDSSGRADSAQQTDDEQQPVAAANTADWSIDDTELDTQARHAVLEGFEELARAERSAAPLASSPPSLRLRDSPSPLQQQQQQRQQQQQQQQQQQSFSYKYAAAQQQHGSSAAQREQHEQSSSSDANMSYIELYLSGLSRSSARESAYTTAARTPLPPPRRSALVDEPTSANYINSSSSGRQQQMAAAVSFELSNVSGLSPILRQGASPSYAHMSTHSSGASAVMNGAAPKLQLLAPNRQRWLDDLKQRYHIIGSGGDSADHTSNGHSNGTVPAAQQQQQQQQQQYGKPQRATNSSASSSKSRHAQALRQPAASPLAHVDVDKWLASRATPAQQHSQSQLWSPRSQSPPRARGTTTAAAAVAVPLAADRSGSRTAAAVALSPRNPLLNEYSSGSPLFETSTAADSAVRLGYASMLSAGSERNSASGRLNASFYSSVGSSSACASSARKLRTVYRDRSGNVIVTDA
jgi:trimeric autotransporter adhesin